MAIREVRPVEELDQPRPEHRFQRGDRQPTVVRRRVDPVARQAAGQHRARREAVRVVRHRDDDVLAAASLLPLEECREDLRHRAHRARSEIRDLDRRERRRRVLENARPAEVVEVVSRALGVTAVDAEAGDRAVHRGLRRALRADPEPRRDARTKRLEDDVRLRHEIESRRRVLLSDRR